MRATYAAAAAAAARCTISRQCSRTSRVAALETRLKSLPTSERHNALSGWADQPPGAARYFEIEPESRTKAQSARADLQADKRNTVAIRSGPSCSSMIVSAGRTYFSDLAASEAPALKNRQSAATEISRGGSGKVSTIIGDIFPEATLPSDSLIASTEKQDRDSRASPR